MKYTIIGGDLLSRMAVKDSDGKIEQNLLGIKIEKEEKKAELQRTTKKIRKRRKHKR